MSLANEGYLECFLASPIKRVFFYSARPVPRTEQEQFRIHGQSKRLTCKGRQAEATLIKVRTEA